MSPPERRPLHGIGDRVTIRLPLRCYLAEHDEARNGEWGRVVRILDGTAGPDEHVFVVRFRQDGHEERYSRNELEVCEE